jgi:hypothetical protein
MLRQYKSHLAHFLIYGLFTALALWLAIGTAGAADAVVPAPAPADTAGSDGNVDTEVGGFLVFDTSRDGYIDPQEATADPSLAREFNKVDVNQDGRLSLDEFNMGFAMK